MVKLFSKEDVLKKAEEYHVKFVRLQFTDIFGVLKNVAITVEDLPRALDGLILFDSSAVDGIVTEGETDIRLIPDPDTFVIFPWRPREGAVARLICDVAKIDGTPYPGCSRGILKQTLKEMADNNLNLYAGSRAEFFMFKVNESGQPTIIPHDLAGYCDLTPLDLGENARREMVLTLEEMDIEIGSSHHELAPGQHEIVLKADGALAMADKIATMRFVVRTIAQRHGLHASFMPKPIEGVSGSGMHLHLTLFSEFTNIFFDAGVSNKLSDNAQHFMAGILEHARAITAITNPLVNSYKRLIPNDTAPRLRGWSIGNRATMLRVPGETGGEVWIDVRTPDGACNPYLALAVLAQAGYEGMRQELPLSKPLECKPGSLFKTQNIFLPLNLGEALESLHKDKMISKVLGKHVMGFIQKVKQAEWNRYQEAVHPWEVNEYLSRY
ncbi:glutamine synthetase family protein [Zhaonella formicivorans]|uniref:glutamine synthetase family protein n=1 Tax=Zhaonella formicivorans TaxID=2528593 RepID=UPI0010E6BFCC|nr:glutamine synthetase family protein [Zhaonella formicivorans]